MQVFVVGALYIAAIFLFMAMAILALKILSTLSEDKKRYRVLYRLGADEQEQSKALFQQTFSFFFLPFAIPILLSIPTGWICGRIMKLTGFCGAADGGISHCGCHRSCHDTDLCVVFYSNLSDCKADGDRK